MAGGRPTKFKDEYIEQARNYSYLGATDEQVAKFFDVTTRTITRWKDDYPEFCLALKEGKEIADAKVSKSLYERATGYSHNEDKIFNDNGTPLVVPTTKHYPPDPTSMIFWLKNRQPELWREKREEQAPESNEPISKVQIEVVGANPIN